MKFLRKLTEAAFLSSIGWRKDSISSRKNSDVLQHPAVTSREVRKGWSKYLKETHCASKVTSAHQSSEAKDFSITGHKNSEAGVYPEVPAPESGSFVASRISKACVEHRVQVPTNIPHRNKVRETLFDQNIINAPRHRKESRCQLLCT